MTLMLFVATLASVILMAASFWQAFYNSGVSAGPLPVIFLFLSLGGLTGIFFLFRKATDRAGIESEINDRVRQARTKILQDLSNEKEEKTEEGTTQKDVEKIIADLVPRGNFKTTESFARKLLANLADEFQMIRGMYFEYQTKSRKFKFLAGYALTEEDTPPDFTAGENLNGEAARSKELMVISDIPEDYFEAESGLGKSRPRYLSILPVVDEKSTLAVIEIATFIEIGAAEKEILTGAAKQIAEKLSQLKKS